MFHLPTTAALLRYTIQANVLGLPAIVVPLGTVGGTGAAGAALPAGLQLIGRPWHEATLLRAGAALEASLAARGGGAPLPRVMMPNPLLQASRAAGPAVAREA
jgi:aspartyl-tRNA(Asn)/glutamyl-tRNA(Gln) amidotransferase subunit A